MVFGLVFGGLAAAVFMWLLIGVLSATSRPRKQPSLTVGACDVLQEAGGAYCNRRGEKTFLETERGQFALFTCRSHHQWAGAAGASAGRLPPELADLFSSTVPPPAPEL